MPLTQEELQAIVKQTTDALAPQIKTITDQQAEIVKTQGILADTLKHLPPARTASGAKGGKEGDGAAPQDGGPKYLTAEDLAKVLDQRDQQRQQSATLATQRDAFIGQNLAKLPAVYKAKLGSDPNKWADEAKVIQAEFEADFKVQGGKAETVGGAAGDGGKTAAQEKPDFSKLPAMERIHKGLEALPVPTAVTADSAAAAKK